MSTVAAWEVTKGQTLRFTHWGKKIEGIVTATANDSRDSVTITLTCGVHKFQRGTVLELVKVA